MNNLVKWVGSEGHGSLTAEWALSCTEFNEYNCVHSVIKVVWTGYDSGDGVRVVVGYSS